MSEPYYLGGWLHVINVYWPSGRFLERDEYIGPLIASPFHWKNGPGTGSGLTQEFIEGNCAVNSDDSGPEYVSIPGLEHDRYDPPGYWVDTIFGDLSFGGWGYYDTRPVWHQPWPVMTLHVPFNGFLRTRFVPYDTDTSGNPLGWLDVTRAESLSAPTKVYKDDIYYAVNNVSSKGAGTYVGMPMYLLRSGAGFIANSVGSNSNASFYAAGRNIFVAKDAVRLKDSEITSEDIFQLKDFSEPYLTVGDVITDTANNCTKSLYVIDDFNREVMLAYNGNGGCTGKMPLVYAQICSIGGIKLSFAATACINQPVNRNPEDLVITDLTIYTQAVTHA